MFVQLFFVGLFASLFGGWERSIFLLPRAGTHKHTAQYVCSLASFTLVARRSWRGKQKYFTLFSVWYSFRINLFFFRVCMCHVWEWTVQCNEFACSLSFFLFFAFHFLYIHPAALLFLSRALKTDIAALSISSIARSRAEAEKKWIIQSIWIFGSVLARRWRFLFCARSISIDRSIWITSAITSTHFQQM